MVIYVKEHEFFNRDGDDLKCQVPVSLVQAALGAEISIPVLSDDKERSITIPEGAQPGEIIRIKGAGMPSLRRGRGYGDLFVHVAVKIPTKLSQRQRELLLEFSEIEKQNIGSKTRDFWNKIKGM